MAPNLSQRPLACLTSPSLAVGLNPPRRAVEPRVPLARAKACVRTWSARRTHLGTSEGKLPALHDVLSRSCRALHWDGSAEQRPSGSKVRGSRGGRRRGVRGGHQWPDVLHLHGRRCGGGPRARVRVPGTFGRRARVVPGATGAGLGTAGAGERGKQPGPAAQTVVDLPPLRARAPRRRRGCARLGVLEDVRGATGRGPICGI